MTNRAASLLTTYRTGLQAALRHFERTGDVFSANLARRYLARVNESAAELERWSGFAALVMDELGKNGLGPAIDGLIEQGREKVQRKDAA
jgi:hypothetical protein